MPWKAATAPSSVPRSRPCPVVSTGPVPRPSLPFVPPVPFDPFDPFVIAVPSPLVVPCWTVQVYGLPKGSASIGSFGDEKRTRQCPRVPKVRHSLDGTDRRIAAALLIAPRASWRTLAHCLDLSERTVVRRAARCTPTARCGPPRYATPSGSPP